MHRRFRCLFLRPEFKDLAAWQRGVRRFIDLLLYSPARVPPEVQVVVPSRQRDGYREERLTFRTTPQLRVPRHTC